MSLHSHDQTTVTAIGAPPGAVIVGAHANGLGIIRSLARRRIPIAVISTRPFDVAHYSRWVDERHELPELHERPDVLAEFLERHAPRWQGRVVFPSNDDALTSLARHHERLSHHYCLPLQPWEQIRCLVDKDAMQQLAVECGLDLPECYGAADSGIAGRDDLRFPVLVKPIQHDRLISRYGTKLFVARDRDELQLACARLAEVELEGLVYEFIPGADDNIYVDCVYRDGQGNLVGGVTVRKLRQNPPGTGGARAAEIVADQPAMRAATARLLERAGFRGMAFAEYKRDPRDGRFRFIEVNPRAVLFNSILSPTGIDLVDLAWRDFVEHERPLRAEPTGWRGSWIHLQADLFCTLRYRRSERLSWSEIIAPYRRSKTFAVWSASDPMPFVMQTARALRAAAPRLRRI